jgi:hypothetical protein
LVLDSGRHITGPPAFINDCRSKIQNSGVTTPAELDRVNVRLVHVAFLWYLYTILLLDYVIRFWCAKK